MKMKKLILITVLIGFGICLSVKGEEVNKEDENLKFDNNQILDEKELSKYFGGFFERDFRLENAKVILWDDYQKIKFKKDN